MLKRIIALIMVFAITCTLFVGCKKDENTDSTVDTNQAVDATISEKDQQEKEEFMDQQIIAGTLIVGGPDSDFTVTVQSDYFADTSDVVDIETGTVTSTGTVFLEDMMHVSDMYIGSVDSNFCNKDIVTITTEKEQKNRAQYSLNGNEMELNIHTTSQSVSMSLGNRYVCIKDLSEDFSYRIMEMGMESSRDITIDGYMSGEKGDVEISYENEVYTVTSTKELHGLYVMASGYNSEDEFSTSTEHASDVASKYQITIEEDGNIAIEAIKGAE